MWKYFGTFVNVFTVVFGSLIGLALRARRVQARPDARYGLREKLPDTMMACLGLCTFFASASGLIGITSGVQALVCVSSMVIGLLIGYGLRLDDRINGLGETLLKYTGGQNEAAANPASGFVTACLLFCVGSMTVLGAFESAENLGQTLDLNCHTTLLIKSMLDFVSSACLSVTYGASVMASAGFVLVFQGALTLLASMIQPFLAGLNVMPMINCVGSLLLIAIAMNLIGLKKIKTADYLPALIMPVFICLMLRCFGISA